MKTFEKKVVGLMSLFLIMSLVVPDFGWAQTQQTTSTPDQGNIPVRAVTQAATPKPVSRKPASTNAFNSSTSSPLSRVIPRSVSSNAPNAKPAAARPAPSAATPMYSVNAQYLLDIPLPGGSTTYFRDVPTVVGGFANMVSYNMGSYLYGPHTEVQIASLLPFYSVIRPLQYLRV